MARQPRIAVLFVCAGLSFGVRSISATRGAHTGPGPSLGRLEQLPLVPERPVPPAGREGESRCRSVGPLAVVFLAYSALLTASPIPPPPVEKEPEEWRVPDAAVLLSAILARAPILPAALRPVLLPL